LIRWGIIYLQKEDYRMQGKRLTVCVTCVWAGVDSAWKQEKLEARKILENAAESHTSGARFVRQPARLPEPLLKKDDTANMTRFYNELCF
jgi:hypothetical protein